VTTQKTSVPKEIIVVNNNSSDDSVKIALSFGVKLFHEPNPGPAAARNLGISKARGEFLVLLDADVELPEGWVEACLQQISDPFWDVVQSPIIPGGPPSFMLDFRTYFISRKTYQSFTYLVHAKTSFPLVNTAAVMLKRQLVNDSRLKFNETLKRCEDSDFSIQLFFAGANFKLLPSFKIQVHDRRTPRQYLQRSFWTGFYTIRFRTLWGVTKASNIFSWELADSKNPTKRIGVGLYYFLNLLASRIGEFSARVTARRLKPQNFVRAQSSYKPSLKMNFIANFLADGKAFGLRDSVRMIDLGTELVLLDALSGQREVLNPMERNLFFEKFMKVSNPLPDRKEMSESAQRILDRIEKRNLLGKI
jgi:glycosyltransferase involved in cell wall biosynthesis